MKLGTQLEFFSMLCKETSLSDKLVDMNGRSSSDFGQYG